MNILVTNIDTDDEIFEGNAEDFLEVMEYDEELELVLNELDFLDIGTETEFQNLIITKTEDTELLDD